MDLGFFQAQEHTHTQTKNNKKLQDIQNENLKDYHSDVPPFLFLCK